jgi:hypothetical protein
MSDAEQLIALSESEDEKRKRYNRERKREQRAREALEEAAQNPEKVEELWQRNSADFAKKNPKQYAAYQQQHQNIAELTAEVDEIVKSVKAGLRAETRTAETRDSKEIFPRPDLSFKDCMEEMRAHGLLNYKSIESAVDHDGDSTFRVAEGTKLEATQTNIYRLYGFRLCLTNDTLRDITDALSIYALRTGDASLDWSVVREAIKYRKTNGGWHENDAEFKKLLAERTKKLPLSLDQQINRTLSDIEAWGQHEIDF